MLLCNRGWCMPCTSIQHPHNFYEVLNLKESSAWQILKKTITVFRELILGNTLSSSRSVVPPHNTIHPQLLKCQLCSVPIKQSGLSKCHLNILILNKALPHKTVILVPVLDGHRITCLLRLQELHKIIQHLNKPSTCSYPLIIQTLHSTQKNSWTKYLCN